MPRHALISLITICGIANAQYSATYLPSNAPPTTQEGQAGTNQCGTGLNQTSACQNVYVNSVTDFCLWGPPNPGPDAVIGNTERIEVAWCIKNGTGSRIIPDGAIKSAHFVQTPDFIQVTGTGDLTLINVPAGDTGGELDPHGQDGNGNPIGGLVFTTAFGELEQIHEWTSFISATQYCIRVCKPGPMAETWCQHIYDTMGCEWNMPANYGDGFESCQGNSGEPMGVYGGSTFHQGEPATPAAHPRPSSSNCKTTSTVGNGFIIKGTSIGTATPTPTTTVSNRPSQVVTSTKGPATSTSSSSASRTASIDGWERFVIAISSTLILFMAGALLVL